MNNIKNLEISIYTNIKDDMEFIIKQIENHNIDIIRKYLSGIEALIKQLEKEEIEKEKGGKNE